MNVERLARACWGYARPAGGGLGAVLARRASAGFGKNANKSSEAVVPAEFRAFMRVRTVAAKGCECRDAAGPVGRIGFASRGTMLQGPQGRSE